MLRWHVARTGAFVDFSGASALTTVVEMHRPRDTALMPASDFFVSWADFVGAIIFFSDTLCKVLSARNSCLTFGGAVPVKVLADVRGRLSKALKRLARADVVSEAFFGTDRTLGTFKFSVDPQFSMFVLLLLRNACELIFV